MAKNRNNIDIEPQPTKKEEIPQQFNPTPLLTKMDKLESKFELLDETVKFIKEANWILIFVIGLGLVALIISLMAGVIQSFKSESETKIEYIKSVESLSNSVKRIEDLLNNKFPSITPNPSQ